MFEDDNTYLMCPITQRHCYAFADNKTEDGKKEVSCVFWDGDDLCYCMVYNALRAIVRLGDAVHGDWWESEIPPHIFVQSDVSVSGEINTY